MKTKNDFPQPVIHKLAERANQRCSNPDCGIPTSGPHSTPSKSVITGVAAHIYAAKAKDKRYDPNMTPEQRSSIENGVWLCATCSNLIDRDEGKYKPELLKKWKSEHEVAISREQAGFRPFKKESLGVVSKVSAKAFIEAGLRRDKIHFLLKTQEKALQNKNMRLISFLNDFVKPELIDVPMDWRGLIAGFPILAEDIRSESIIELVKLVKEMHPYISRELRKEYHVRVTPILIGILADVESFLEDSNRAGGFPLLLSLGDIPSWKEWVPWLQFRERSVKADEALVRGRWNFSVPVKVFESNPKIKIGRTWAGFLFDIIYRLPDPDKQNGRWWRDTNLASMMHIWCSTAPQDFVPALTKIVRTPVNSSDHTLAGIYKIWHENSEKSPE